MSQQHVEVPLVHRDVGRLAYGPAGQVKLRRHVREAHEVLEIRDGGIPALSVQMPDERRPVDRRKHHLIAADRDRTFGIAGVVNEFRRRRRTERTSKPSRNMNPIPFHLRAGFPPAPKRVRLLGKGDADLPKHGVRIGFDGFDQIVGQDVDGADRTADGLRSLDPHSRPLGAPRGSAASPALQTLVHWSPRSGMPGS